MAYGTINADLMTTSDGVSSSGLYGFKNRIINGAQVINQRGYSATPTTDGTYTLDRWKVRLTQASKFSVAQGSASGNALAAGFNNCLTVTSASSYSVLTGDFFGIQQDIEGYNISDLQFGTASGKTITLSFWVNSSLTGSFGGFLANATPNQFYPFTYTISSANTWEQKSITIPASVTGTWNSTNGQGLQVEFSLGAGATYSGTANAWTSSAILQPTGSTSVVGTNGATWSVTGVQLEKGSTATSFDYRSYSAELAMCQRYFLPMQCVNWCGYRPTASTGALQVPFVYPILRAAPTFTQLSGSVNGSNVTFDVGQAQSNYLRLYHNITYAAGTVAEVNLSFTLSAEL